MPHITESERTRAANTLRRARLYLSGNSARTRYKSYDARLILLYAQGLILGEKLVGGKPRLWPNR